MEKLPTRYVIPHGEPHSPAGITGNVAGVRGGTVWVGRQPEITSTLKDKAYEFAVPPRLDASWLALKIGDARQRVRMEPMLRPELTSLTAVYALPEYLGRKEKITKDVRGGAISVVKGSQVELAAAISRALSKASVNGKDTTPSKETISTTGLVVNENSPVEFRWRDEFGLSGKEPFVLSITAKEDESPTVMCEDLPRQKVLLDIEQLAFTIHTEDDFGVKQVGIEWNGLDSTGNPTSFHGERIVASGGQDKESLEVKGTFSAESLGIDPQPIQMRIFAEDYFPGRKRAYSLPYTFFILTKEEHAIWLTEQLNKWHRQSLEVRDREKQLHETNKQLRELTSAELDRPENRRRLEQQAAAERANGRRLTNLVAGGEDLVKQAARNPEFGVGHLEKWAEMLQILKDISGNRMPSVADLLKEGSQAPVASKQAVPTDSKTAGQMRAMPQGGKGSQVEQKKPPQSVPSVVDVESSQGGAKKKDGNPAAQEDEKKKPSQPRLTLPQTLVMGNGDSKPKPPATPAEEKVDEAIKQQQDLLAEFDKIAEELNKVLANLEGSTLVKRLKAASRVQYKIGGKISEKVGDSFGVAASRIDAPATEVFNDLSKQEAKASQDVSYIMDDLQAYLERRQLVRFQTVLEEMRKKDVVGGLRQLGDDLKKENGLSIAQSEFWSDSLDRWAENLVDPACAGKCPGCKSKGSLPPSIVLEVMQILEGEVNLREETRVTQQAIKALSREKHTDTAKKLSVTQEKLKDRVVTVNKKISELPDAQADFGKEMELLAAVAGVMEEATEILARPDTGRPAIAAETEAIELLLRSKRINPKGGGGGGSSPGGGGNGNTSDSAIASCWEPAPTPRKSAKTGERSSPRQRRGRPCRKNSRTSTNTNRLEKGSENDPAQGPQAFAWFPQLVGIAPPITMLAASCRGLGKDG
ncbi:MAG: hypothetical protein U0903_05315 [Planctomycetales bacterium]